MGNRGFVVVERGRVGPPDITSQESNGERMAAAAFWMNSKPLGYLGIPAANHAPPLVTRMRSTGLVQVSGGAGESES
jgi:hypothetical protein